MRKTSEWSADADSTSSSPIARSESGGCESYTLDCRRLKHLRPRARDKLSAVYQLPVEWSFDNLPVESLRRIWDSMWLLALVHHGVANHLHTAGALHFGELMIWPRDVWVSRLSACSEVDVHTVSRVVDLHTYDRESDTPDISLTPLLSIGGNRLAAGPGIVFSSSPERNFCAHVAREYPALYDAQSNLLSSHMAEGLRKLFESAGFRARCSLPISTNIGNTDVDLLVWSPVERRVMTAELKWVIHTADFAEVVNRGEATAIKAVNKQLPIHAAALAGGAAELVRRAFDLPDPPQIDASSSMLILRGYVGSPRIPTERFAFVAEPLVVNQLKKGGSLAELADWCRRMPYLPREGRDFRTLPIEIRTQSGIQILTHDVAYKVDGLPGERQVDDVPD